MAPTDAPPDDGGADDVRHALLNLAALGEADSGDLDGLGAAPPVVVDFDHLDDLARVLDYLADVAEKYALPKVDDAVGLLRIQRSGLTVFGDDEGDDEHAQEVLTLVNTVDTFTLNLRSQVVASGAILRKSGRALRWLVANHTEREDRGEALMRMLEGDGGAPSRG
jgi:hypothetical protein